MFGAFSSAVSRSLDPHRISKILNAVVISVGLSVPLLELAVRVAMPRQLMRPCIRPDADIGYVLEPGCEYFDDWGAPQYAYRVRTNNVGARMDRDVDVRTPERRVLLLGDSFTFGWGVEREASFAGILSDRIAARIPDVVLVNGGVGGYSTGHQRKQVERALSSLAPSGVVLFLNSNDFFDNLNLSIDYRTFRWERYGDGVRLVREQVFSPLKRFVLVNTPFRRLDQHSHLWAALKDVWRRQSGVPPPRFEYADTQEVEPELAREVTYTHLRELAHLLRREGIPLLIAWIPARCDLGMSDVPRCPWPVERWAQGIPDTLADRGAVSFVDPLPRLLAQTAGKSTTDFYFPDGHFDERGNRLYADAVESSLGELVARLSEPSERAGRVAARGGR
jgi:lysophospholipase L1-like esterase